MSGPLLKVEDLSVCLGRERNRVVDGVSFELHAGERVAILGPSGCGKTTTLRAVAGFERADRGRITLQSRVLSGPGVHVPAHKRTMGMVFQDFALFPHLDVAENVAFGLQAVGGAERKRIVEEMLALVGLESLERRMPGQLSGGQQQRVALARALAPKPPLLLLDEPFSSLDASLRATTRQHTERVLERVGAAAVLVTHDQAEAMAFAQRLLVMHDGRVEQDGPPEVLYRAPRTAFVAAFLGAANLMKAEAAGTKARTRLGEVALLEPAQGDVLLCVRPEALTLGETGFDVQIVSREYRGGLVLFTVEGDDFHGMVQAAGDAPWRVGDRTKVRHSGNASVVVP